MLAIKEELGSGNNHKRTHKLENKGPTLSKNAPRMNLLHNVYLNLICHRCCCHMSPHHRCPPTPMSPNTKERLDLISVVVLSSDKMTSLPFLWFFNDATEVRDTVNTVDTVDIYIWHICIFRCKGFILSRFRSSLNNRPSFFKLFTLHFLRLGNVVIFVKPLAAF